MLLVKALCSDNKQDMIVQRLALFIIRRKLGLAAWLTTTNSTKKPKLSATRCSEKVLIRLTHKMLNNNSDNELKTGDVRCCSLIRLGVLFHVGI